MKRTLYNSEHEAFRESVREFVNRNLVPNAERFIDQKCVDRAVWLEAGKQGLLGLEVPEEFGGSDAGDYRFNAVLTEELSKVSAAMPSIFGIHFDVVAPYLVKLTNDEQKSRWLPRFCEGELTSAIAMTEPSGGSDLKSMRSIAVRSDGHWLLNGSKIFITNGASADLVIVAARTTPELGAKGITLFVVEEGMSGFTRGQKLSKVGQPESDTSELFFHDVAVPLENVIGEIDRGFIHMMDMLPQERIGAAVSNLAHSTQIFRETVEYAKERKAFGQSVGSMQHNKFMLADMATRLDVTQAFIDHCILLHTQGNLSAFDAAKAKWWSAQVQNDVLDVCVQLFGGYGYMTEYRVARAWMDARVTKIWAGSNEIMKELIGRELGL